MQIALSDSAVAAIMLSAIDILCFNLSSADNFAISASTFTTLKSFSKSVALSFAVSLPSFLSVNWYISCIQSLK